MNILILEDDISYGVELEMLCSEWGYHVTGIFNNTLDANEAIVQNRPDFMLVDIHLKGMEDGISFCQRIKNLEIPVIFLTSANDDESFLKAKECRMAAFLVKPIDKLTLKTVLDLSINDHKVVGQKKELETTQTDHNDSFLLKKKNIYHKVEFKKITFIQSDLEYVYIHTRDDKFVLRESLRNFEDILNEDCFFRCHKSYIININFLHSIDAENNFLYLNDQAKIPLSRRKKMDLIKMMNILS